MNLLTSSRIAIGVCALSALAAGYYFLNQPEAEASVQSTTDAYVQADFTVVVPQVAGVMTRVAVSDNQSVEAGALVAEIDDRSLRIAVDNAAAQVASAEANIDSLKAQITRQDSAIEQARAAVAASVANLKFAEIDKDRTANLATAGTGSVRSRQEAQAQWDTQRAALQRDNAGLHSAEQQTGILNADLESGKADLLKAEAARASAQLNLSYARVTAPVSGVVAQLRARVGGYASIGDPLLTLVPLDALYIDANFRETQMARIAVGQPVKILVDALPGVVFTGQVASLGPASGVSFSTVAPHNATGNFTKIVQRLPVRIHLDPGQKNIDRLRVGMSVQPTIDVSASQR